MARKKLALDSAEIAGLYATGKSVRHIARVMDVSESTIINRLREMGIMRNREQAGELRRGHSTADGHSAGYTCRDYWRTRDQAVERQSFFCSERGFVRPAECLDCYERDTFRKMKITREECIRQHMLPGKQLPMSKNEELIWTILRNRRGPQAAITARGISSLLDGRLSEVQVRAIIRKLTIDHALPIASVTTNPGGFFIPQTRDQKEHYANSLKSRIRKIAVRLRAYEKTVAEGILRQLELGLVDAERGEREVVQGHP